MEIRNRGCVGLSSCISDVAARFGDAHMRTKAVTAQELPDVIEAAGLTFKRAGNSAEWHHTGAPDLKGMTVRRSVFSLNGRKFRYSVSYDFIDEAGKSLPHDLSLWLMTVDRYSSPESAVRAAAELQFSQLDYWCRTWAVTNKGHMLTVCRTTVRGEGHRNSLYIAPSGKRWVWKVRGTGYNDRGAMGFEQCRENAIEAASNELVRHRFIQFDLPERTREAHAA
jgi:hypothetical protein